MKYLIITEEGNGYQCSCCRDEWLSYETMEFESEQELKEYIGRHNELYKENRNQNDSRIIKAYLLVGDGEPVYDSA